jgi:hypothetical protein
MLESCVLFVVGVEHHPPHQKQKTKKQKQWNDGEMELTFGINGNGA